VYSYSRSTGSSIDQVNLDSGVRTILRRATSNVLYANAALAHGQLLYELTNRCAQQLLLGAPNTARHDRVLLSLPSTVLRDPGYQAGYQQAWNSASLCKNRGSGHGATVTLGATALGAAEAYVSESPNDVRQTRIVSIALG
jgi:hypothetical protein